MQYRYLGNTGVQVSPLCLGTMMFGGQTSEPDSRAIIDKAIACDEISCKVVEGPDTLEAVDALKGG